MLAFVLNKYGDPLMPCKPSKAKSLLVTGKAKVVKRLPFTIKLLYGSSGYKQQVIAGMDTGSKIVGCAVVANNKVVYQSEVQLRQDVSKKMERRAMYRRTRRGRKTRYRKARWQNRASLLKKERLAPSIRSKLDSHLREKKQVESILPVSHWKVETASFDIHKITNPTVSGVGYQEGDQKGFYNVKAYILHRDGYQCQSGRKIKHSNKLHIHHIQFRSEGGTNTPSNLITLCKRCHEDLHAGKFEFKKRKSKTKHSTEIGILKSQLKKRWSFEETFGYETKFKRENILYLPKTHYNDAIAICCEDGEIVNPFSIVFYKKHVAKGDFQQTKGIRSEKIIPIGKLFGIRKFDYIETKKGAGFVKGKRSSGFFSLMDIFNKTTHASINIKKGCKRVTSRTTTLTERSTVSSPD